MAKVVAEIRNSEGRRYQLLRGRMELVPEIQEAAFYRTTRGQVAKVLKFKPAAGPRKRKNFSSRWQKFNYTFVDKVRTTIAGWHVAFGRASKTRVHLGCQTFMGRNAAILREWALSN